MSCRSFPLAPVLSVYQNRLLCHLDEYRAFLDYMTNTRIPLWEVESARRTVAKAVAKQFPDIKRVAALPEKTDNGTAGRYVKAVARDLGYSEVALEPMRVRFRTRTLSEVIG